MRRCMAVGTGLAAAAVALGAFLGTGGASAQPATSVELSVVEQGYSTTLPTDPYGDQSSDLHVSAASGQEAYRSFVAIDTNALPVDATVLSATVTLVPDTGSSTGNENTGSAALSACPLAQVMRQPFDPSAPPADACAQVHVAGKADASGNWTFDLLPIVAWWTEHGEATGIAVVPDTSTATNSFVVTFSQGGTRAVATYEPASTAPTNNAAAPASSVPGSTFPPPTAPASPVVIPAAGLSAPAPPSAVAPTVAPSAPAAQPTAAATHAGGGIDPLWLLVAFVAGGIVITPLVMGRSGRRKVALAWAGLAPAPREDWTPRLITMLPRPLRVTVRSDQLVNVAVGLAVAALAWVTLSVRLPHGAPAGIVVLGLTVGSLNGLLAVGLVLIYRATRVINFAQGALGAFSAVLAFELMRVAHWPWGVAVPLAVVAAVAMSAVMELAFLRRLRTAPRTIVTVATIGIAQIMTFLQLVLQPLFEHSSSQGVSAVAGRFPSPFSRPVFTLFPVLFRGDHIVILLAVPLVLVALHRFLTRTWTGMGIRGVAENADRAGMLGWPAPRLSTTVWAIAGLLSAAAALLQAPVSSFATSGAAGPGLILHGLAAAALGRMRSIPVTFAASLGLGVIEQLVFFNYSRAAPMDGLLLAVILIAFLLQSRTLGRSLWQEASSWTAIREVRPVPYELRDLVVVRAGRQVGPGLLLALALLMPALLGLDQVRLLSVVYIYAIVGVSLVVLTGWAGQISLGQWGVAGVGSFTVAWLSNHTTANFVIVLVLGSAAAAVVSVVLGLPALRIRGIFAGITTLAFAIAAGEWFFTFGGLEPGRLVPRPDIGWLTVTTERSFYYVVLAAFVLALLIGRNLRQSRVGRLLIAVRDNEQQAAEFGVSVVVAKLSAFAVAGFLAGLAGGVYALLVQRADPMDFGAINSLFVFAIVVIGGLGSVTGAVLGAFYVQGAQYLLPEWARFLATGIGMLLLLMAAPGGLSQLVYDARDRGLRWIAKRHSLIVPSLVADRARQ